MHSRIFLHIMDFNGSQWVEGLNCRFSAASKGSTRSRSQPRNKGLIQQNDPPFSKTTTNNCYIFLTTNAHLPLSRLHPLRNHVVKVTRDIGGSTDPVFVKRRCKESQIPFTKTVNNDVRRF